MSIFVWEARGRQKQIGLLQSEGEAISAAAFSATGDLQQRANGFISSLKEGSEITQASNDCFNEICMNYERKYLCKQGPSCLSEKCLCLCPLFLSLQGIAGKYLACVISCVAQQTLAVFDWRHGKETARQELSEPTTCLAWSDSTTLMTAGPENFKVSILHLFVTIRQTRLSKPRLWEEVIALSAS